MATIRQLAKVLGKKVKTPKGKRILTEIYYNGNVACIPVKCKDYHKELEEYHATSIKIIGG